MNLLKLTGWVLAAMLGTAASVGAEEKPYTARDFGRLPQYDDAVLSTNGTYLALRKPEAKKSTGHVKAHLVVMRLKDRKVMSVLRFPGDETVDSLFWDSDERLIVRPAIQLGWDARAQGTANIYAVNADGSDQIVIYGPGVQAADASRAKKAKADYVYASIVDTLPEDDEHLLLLKGTGELVKLNTRTANQTSVGRLPAAAYYPILDQEKKPRYAVGESEYGDKLVFAFGDSGWTRIAEVGALRQSWSPIGMHEDGKRVYIRSELLGKTDTTAVWDPETDVTQPLYRNDISDHSTIWSTDGRALLGFSAMPGYPEYVITNAEHPEGKLWKRLVASFPKQSISVVDVTRDGAKALIAVSDAYNWGDYYLFDVANNKAEYLLSRTSWLDPNRMSDVKPITVKARDGLVMQGYLTLPRGKDPKNLPMVVNVHGGPHGPRDTYSFDPEVQFLASRGYAVLQINFRGSGGYGQQFEMSGYRKWGREMQDDVTDATLWAIEQGYADRKRICIMGASYGGYATGMGLVREPDLYQCGIGGVGVYDLTLMYDKGDIQRRTSGVKFMERAIGTDEAELKANSAVYNVDKITKPLFLWQGELDERVPKAHYFRLADALKAAGKPVELMMKEREGHGFVNEDNRTELFERMASFLDKHIGH